MSNSFSSEISTAEMADAAEILADKFHDQAITGEDHALTTDEMSQLSRVMRWLAQRSTGIKQPLSGLL